MRRDHPPPQAPPLAADPSGRHAAEKRITRGLPGAAFSIDSPDAEYADELRVGLRVIFGSDLAHFSL